LAQNGIPEVPIDCSPQMRKFLTAMRNAVLRQSGFSHTQPRTPANLTVTPIAGGNYIQFTKTDGDRYVLLWSRTPTVADAISVDLVLSPSYPHVIGEPAVTIYYWVKAKKTGAPDSALSDMKQGTTLAMGAATTIPEAPPQGDTPVTGGDGTTVYGRQTGGGFEDF
jgi:hypothetical protein